MCVAISPSVFAIDSEGKAIVKPGATDDQDRIMRAAEECPALAVIVEDSDTNERLFP
jgi:ferredoxin